MTTDAVMTEEAHSLFHARKFAEASALYATLLPMQADDYLLWGNMGICQHALGRYDASVAFLQRALELRPEAAGVWRYYGRGLAALNRKDEALAALARAVTLAPQDYNAQAAYGAALREFGQLEAALAAYDAAFRLNPDYLDALWNRSDILLTLGRFSEGWKDYEIRWQLGKGWPFARLAKEEAAYTSRRWKGEDLSGKTILVYMEQGFGDTIFASRFVPALKARGARVIFKCHPDLHRLFAPLADRTVGLEKVEERVDYHVPVMSLPGLLGIDAASLSPCPTLAVPALPPAVHALFERDKKKLKAGIVWTGSPTYGANHKRAVSFDRFLPLAEVPGVQLYSLQKGEAEKDIAAAGAEAIVPALGPHLGDFADTAAVLKGLDLIIMTDSSVAHLAGSIGAPVWNLLAYRSYWVYFTGRDDNPWYPSMRLFRQREPGDWDDVFRRVADELRKLTSASAAT